MYVYLGLNFMENSALAFKKATKVAWFVYSLLNLLTELAFLGNFWSKFLTDSVTFDFRAHSSAAQCIVQQITDENNVGNVENFTSRLKGYLAD